MTQLLRENSFELYEKLLDYNLVLIADESWSKCIIKQFFYYHTFLNKDGNLILEDETNFFLTFVDPYYLFLNIIRVIKPQKWGFSIVNRNCILFENPTDAAMCKLYT